MLFALSSWCSRHPAVIIKGFYPWARFMAVWVSFSFYFCSNVSSGGKEKHLKIYYLYKGGVLIFSILYLQYIHGTVIERRYTMIRLLGSKIVTFKIINTIKYTILHNKKLYRKSVLNNSGLIGENKRLPRNKSRSYFCQEVG